MADKLPESPEGIQPSTDLPGYQFELTKMGVDQAFQGRGVGWALHCSDGPCIVTGTLVGHYSSEAGFPNSAGLFFMPGV